MSRRFSFLLLISACVGIFCWAAPEFFAWRAGRRVRAALPERKFDEIRVNIGILCRHLTYGMRKHEVLHFLGPPQNPESENVWVWRDKPVANSSPMSWRELIVASDGYYLIFVNDRLAMDRLFSLSGTPISEVFPDALWPTPCALGPGSKGSGVPDLGNEE